MSITHTVRVAMFKGKSMIFKNGIDIAIVNSQQVNNTKKPFAQSRLKKVSAKGKAKQFQKTNVSKNRQSSKGYQTSKREDKGILRYNTMKTDETIIQNFG